MVLQDVFSFFLLAAGLPTCACFPKSLFLQTNDLPVNVTVMLEDVCIHHTLNSSVDFIEDLVLQQTANNGVVNNASLQVIEPYFGCFRRVFFGTETKAGFYCSQMVGSSAFRDNEVAVALASARTIAARYRGHHDFQFGWYVTHEGWLDYFGEGCSDSTGSFNASSTVFAYADFVKRVGDGLRAINEAAVLWSPSVGPNLSKYGYTGNWTTFAVGWSQFLTLVGTSLTKIVVQDGIGKGSRLMKMPSSTQQAKLLMTETCETVMARVKVVERSAHAVGWKGENIAINMEMFTNNASGAYGLTGDPFEMARRSACYDLNNVVVHASWEIRFWYAAKSTYIPYSNAAVVLANGTVDATATVSSNPSTHVFL